MFFPKTINKSSGFEESIKFTVEPVQRDLEEALPEAGLHEGRLLPLPLVELLGQEDAAHHPFLLADLRAQVREEAVVVNAEGEVVDVWLCGVVLESGGEKTTVYDP